MTVFEGWSFPLVVAHYRVYGDAESWDVYGERHIVVDTGMLIPEYSDLTEDVYRWRRANPRS